MNSQDLATLIRGMCEDYGHADVSERDLTKAGLGYWHSPGRWIGEDGLKDWLQSSGLKIIEEIGWAAESIFRFALASAKPNQRIRPRPVGLLAPYLPPEVAAQVMAEATPPLALGAEPGSRPPRSRAA